MVVGGRHHRTAPHRCDRSCTNVRRLFPFLFLFASIPLRSPLFPSHHLTFSATHGALQTPPPPRPNRISYIVIVTLPKPIPRTHPTNPPHQLYPPHILKSNAQSTDRESLNDDVRVVSPPERASGVCGEHTSEQIGHSSAAGKVSHPRPNRRVSAINQNKPRGDQRMSRVSGLEEPGKPSSPLVGFFVLCVKNIHFADREMKREKKKQR
jgi:hypothetical protein